MVGTCILQNDIDLIREIEVVLGKQLDKFECKENEVLDDIKMVRYQRTIDLFLLKEFLHELQIFRALGFHRYLLLFFTRSAINGQLKCLKVIDSLRYSAF